MSVNFKISDDLSLKICFPKLKFKENSYIGPSRKLHRFDFAYVILEYKNKKCIILNYEWLGEILNILRSAIFNLLKNKLELPEEIFPGKFGLLYSQAHHDFCNKDNQKNIEFFEGFYFFLKYFEAAWLYSKNHKYYFEVSPLYPWFNRDPYHTENFFSFKTFKKNYTSEVYELSVKQICSWIYPIVKLQQRLEIEFEEQYQQLKKDK